MIVPARREIDEMLLEVRFIAEFPYTAGGPATLRCRGEYAQTFGPFEAASHPFEARIRVSLPSEVSA